MGLQPSDFNSGDIALSRNTGNGTWEFAKIPATPNTVFTFDSTGAIVALPKASLGGATTFAALTDAATAALPTLNTPLANALAALGLITPYNLGAISGAVALDMADGAYQYCALNDDTTFSITGGAEGSAMVLEIQYAISAKNISFDGIKMSAAAASVMPITLDAWQSYIFTFRHIGGGWTLLSADGPFNESVD